MAMRHITTKLKPQVADHIDSWANYVQLFEKVLAMKDDDLCITTKWIYDICQEFAYQFQGFCQFRCQMANISSNPDTLKTLETNRDAWNLPEVISILRRLIRAGQAKSGGMKVSSNSPFLVQFGYFASIELARLECLMGDFTASLAAMSSINIYDQSEMFTTVTLCHFNVMYHTAVCHLLLRKFTSAVDILSTVVLHISRLLKPGAGGGASGAGAGGGERGVGGGGNIRGGLQQQLQRNLDKVLALAVLASFLCPGYRLDEQVKETMEAKFADRILKLQNADTFQKNFTDLFEYSTPKFISPYVPDYSGGAAKGDNVSTTSHILSMFLVEVQQHQSFMKLKTFLGMYATIDVSKLARFSELSESEVVSQLLSYKHKSTMMTNMSSGTGIQATSPSVNTSDLHFFVDNGAIVVDASSSKSDLNRAHERFFTSGVHKHDEILNQVRGAFASLDARDA
mmetsp:Transcript_4086/g.6707  ORF Transcript_4086/g.6707 Transcript_4086/m.6707 type:complete len:455 (-) Transcript_4086:115-1479(-)